MKSFWQKSSPAFKWLASTLTLIFVTFTADGLNKCVSGIWSGVIDLRDSVHEQERSIKRIETRLDSLPTKDYVDSHIAAATPWRHTNNTN